MEWESFAGACPEIARVAGERFKQDQLVMVGTLRKDGTPRISPCEVDFADRHLFLGMMWRSPKALDLLRDPRLTLHSVTCNKEGTDGDVKLYGRALDVPDAGLQAAYLAALKARTEWVPEEPNYHVFRMDITSAAYVIFGGEQEEVFAWEESSGLRRWTKRSG